MGGGLMNLISQGAQNIVLNGNPTKTFLSSSSMYWSHSLTAVSQIKALTDQNIQVNIGKIVYDIDEPNDVQELCKFLAKKEEAAGASNHDSKKKNLDYPSGWDSSSDSTDNSKIGVITSRHPLCYYTRQALAEAGLL